MATPTFSAPTKICPNCGAQATTIDAKCPACGKKYNKKNRTFLKVFLGIVLAIIVLAAGCTALVAGGAKSVSDSINKDTAAAIADTTLSSCGRKGPLGEVGVNVTIKNSAKKAQDYFVTVSFTAADGKTQLGTGNASADKLQPGATKKAFAAVSDYGVGNNYKGMTCKVTDATAIEVAAK